MHGSGTSILRVCLDSRDLSLNFMVEFGPCLRNSSDSALKVRVPRDRRFQSCSCGEETRRFVDLSGGWDVLFRGGTRYFRFISRYVKS